MKINKKAIITGVSLLTIGSQVILSHPEIVSATEVDKALVDTKQEGVAEVGTFEEYQTALKDVSISHIILTQSFSMKKDITSIPRRNLLIEGNADKGIVLNIGKYALYGQDKLDKNVTLKLNNMSIEGTQKDESRFFELDDDEYGWDIEVMNTSYIGARFLLLSNGRVTFKGNNKIETTHENARVHEVIFAKDSVYNSTAASGSNKPAFNFNGKLHNGKADGKAIIEENAKVNIKISPNNDKYYHYPAFYDKVSQVNVKENASLDIDSAGIAIEFVDSSRYDVNPSLNIESGAVVNLNGRGGGDRPTIHLDQENSSINAKPNSTLIVTGNNSKEVIKTEEDSEINLDNPKAFDLKNTNPRKPIFDADETTLRIKEANIKVWKKTGGNYEESPLYSWNAVSSLETHIDDDESSKTVSTDLDLQKRFQTEDYGRIAGDGDTIQVIAPTFNPVTDKDTQLTGTGQANATITAFVGGEKIGEAVVGGDGRWSISPITPQPEGTVIHIIQTYDGKESNKVEQTVVHLGEESINYFKLGYWQDYGLILEGSVDNEEWPLEDSSKVTKSVKVVNSEGNVVEEIKPVANTDWYQAGIFNGYQAILNNEILSNLEIGEYKLQITTVIAGTEVDETNDLNVKNTSKKVLEAYPGPYHQNYTQIEKREYGNKIISTVDKDNVAYIKVESK